MGHTDVTETLDAPLIDVTTLSTIPRLAFTPDNAWSRERLSFYRMLPDLLKTHKGRFVAILNGAVVSEGDDFVGVATAVYARLGRVPVYIGLVAEQPRFVRIPSFRVVNLAEHGTR